MADIDSAFTQATDNLITLYRGIERKTLDLPLVSFMPLLILFWACVKFDFFFFVGLVLIIPINLVILIRNLFPGHWRYRPFFLSYLYYVWLWIWRGEAPAAPIIFVRPLLDVFVNWHFQRRLRRLRLEILLREGLPDATRSLLVARLDAALERWKSPRIGAIFFTVLLPGIISFPSWYKQLVDFFDVIGIRIPAATILSFVSDRSSSLDVLLYAQLAFGYLWAIPVTAFLAKRGLFIGIGSKRICYPGEQAGSGAYASEKQILGNVGLRMPEIPVDLWLLAIGALPTMFFNLLDPNLYADFARQHDYPQWMTHPLWMTVLGPLVSVGLLTLAIRRRRITGRT
jgi:hypothetical protein